MIAYRDNETADVRYVNAWRAQHLCDSARRLEQQAEKLQKQAAEYRAIAARLNPTS